MTMVDGEVLVSDGTLTRLDAAAVSAEARQAAQEVAVRAGLL
jgi:hypothetical protein